MKTADDQNIIVERPWESYIYLDPEPLALHVVKHMPYEIVTKQTHMRTSKQVIQVRVPSLDQFERFIARLEQETRFRVPMYNADVTPEQAFLYKHHLVPCTAVHIEDEHILPQQTTAAVPLRSIEIQGYPAHIKSYERPITGIKIGKKLFKGDERDVLMQFTQSFKEHDPDVLIMYRAFQYLPYLAHRLAVHSIDCPLHRWHPKPLIYHGGKTVYSYGQVSYRDTPVRLNGRFLVDKTTMVGSLCDVQAIVELCHLSGARFQQVASRSFGSVFQANLMRLLVERDYLVPYKEKPIEKPLSMIEMLNADRAGHTFDPLIGFHTNVAEIDFSSMYPWLIFNHNISADTLLSDVGPFDYVPGTHIRISLAHKGLTPLAIKPLLEQRMHYKQHPSAINKVRASGLKWVLVSSYGYLRFREFKLGLPSAHMAICAFAREILLDAAKRAEELDFRVIHGIIDALYVQKESIHEDEVKSLISDIESSSGIPMSLEGVFKWIVFLPSVVDGKRPVPTRYYGVFRSGDIKVRGIEARQRSTPRLIKQFQMHCIERMAQCCTKNEIIESVPDLKQLLREYIKKISYASAEQLVCTIRISKTVYKNNIPQKFILQQLREEGIELFAGQSVQFIYGVRGVLLPEKYKGNADIKEYTERLVRALYVLLLPFGITKEEIANSVLPGRQETLLQWGVRV